MCDEIQNFGFEVFFFFFERQKEWHPVIAECFIHARYDIFV